MGPYCNFCNNRCFTRLPEGTPEETITSYGIITIIATCQKGQEFERKKTGWNYDRIMEYIRSQRLIDSVRGS